jgi:polysaccharide export outer membrane protein
MPAQISQSKNQHVGAVIGAGARPAPASPTTVVETDYVIGSDDVLVVNVWKEPELSRSVPVRLDGKITLPLIGDVVAEGATAKELQARIEKGLDEYLSKPAVTVIVGEAKSHKFNIIGEIQKPGTYILTAPTTVLDAIAQAGGLRDWAKSKSIYVLRMRSDGTKERLAFNYKRVIRGADRDIEIKTRDTIVVP